MRTTRISGWFLCTHWIGQAHIDLIVLSANRLIELPQAQTKPLSDYIQCRSSQREWVRAGYARAVVCGSRSTELPPNVDMGAPRSP